MQGNKSLRGFISHIVERIYKDDVSGLAAQLAYFFLLSLFPLLIFLFALLPYLPFSYEEALNTIRAFAPEESMKIIESNLENLQGSGKLLSIAIIGTIWSASNGLNAIIRAFNHAYRVEESRSFFIARGMSIIFTFAMIFVFVVALLLPVFGKQIGVFLSNGLGLSEEFLAVWNMFRWLISPIVLFIIFTMLFWIAPNKRLKCLSIFPGALFTTIGWIVVSYLFSFYVDKFGNFSTYGSLGGIIVLMIWFYLTGLIIIIGGQINAILSEWKDPTCT